MRSRPYRKRSSDYLLPFLILVGVGIIVVLIFQVWASFQGKPGDVYFYVPAGKAKVLQYGTTEWQPAFNGTKLLVGDSLKTLNGGRLVLKFYNGTLVRLNQDTQISLVDVSRRSDEEKIALALDYGSLWVNKVSSENVQTSRFEVKTPHMLVKDIGTVFAVDAGKVETARVFKGAVKVDVMADDQNKNQVFDTIDVGVGQEIDLDEASLKALLNHENPSVLLAVRDEFKSAEWYTWNTQEDEKPTDFSHQTQNPQSTDLDPQTVPASASTVTSAQTGTVGVTTPSTANPSTTTDSSVDASATGPTIAIQTPDKKEVTITDGKLVIGGTVSAGTAQVMVRQTLNGSTEDYILQKFKAGDTTFSYNLTDTYGNIKLGQNTYSFFALDAKGQRSENEATLKVTYTKSLTPEAAAAATTSTSTAATTSTAAVSPSASLKVLSFNGGTATTASTVTVSVVKVVGEAHAANKVVVNGLTLTKFKPGDDRWTYYANEKGDNLKPGVNQYEAYALDADGKESPHIKFTITYNKPDATVTTPVAAPTPVNAPTPATPPPVSPAPSSSTTPKP